MTNRMFPLIDTYPEYDGEYGMRRPSLPTIQPSDFSLANSDTVREIANVKIHEANVARRIAEVGMYTSMARGQSDIACTWLTHRGIGEKNIEIDTDVGEAGRGFFGGVGRYASVRTTVKIW